MSRDIDRLTPRTCRTCGCTELDCARCIVRTGGPCWWIEPDLCSTCAPDQRLAGQVLARVVAGDLVEAMVMPGAMVIILDRLGGLQIGCATIDDPSVQPLLVLGEAIYEAVDRIVGAVGTKPQPRPPHRAACIHCKTEVAGVEDLEAIRQHSMTCAASPAVQELQRLRPIAEAAQRFAQQYEYQGGIDVAMLDELGDFVKKHREPSPGGAAVEGGGK